VHDRPPPRAKNSLDLNYLWLAERGGAEIHPGTVVKRLVQGTVPQRWLNETGRGAFRAPQVVLAAGVLGTLGILFRSGLGGPGLGNDVRTNSELIVGASAKRTGVD
jgi:cholesterol oxidase